MNITQTQRTTEEIANYRIARGETISDRLKSVAGESKTAKAVAFRMEQCALRENIWTATDLHTKDGEAFDGTGNLYSCGSKLCAACSANQSREMRKRARKAVESLGSGNYDVRWRSVVLTMPLQRGASVISSIEKINKAFRIMSNRKFWKTRVKGGIKSVEFTVRPDGYHVHIHLLVLSEHLPVNSETERRFERLRKRRRLFIGNLRDEMAYALKAAQIALNGLPIVAVYDVKNRNLKARGNREISLEKALLETAKYITKSESWDKIPDASLVELAEITRWKRMFEILGASIRRGESSEATEDENASLVHKQTLSAGENANLIKRGNLEPSATWRQLLNALDFDTWQRQMKARINRIRAFRTASLSNYFSAATFRLMNGNSFGFETAIN